MKNKDQVKLEEAYISALQKTINVPADGGIRDITTGQPDAPEAVEMKAEPNLQIALEPSDVGGCGCGGGDNSEESEEQWMVRSNLFSIFTNAKKVHTLTMEGMDLEPWMQQKIALCTDYLESVMKSAAYRAAVNSLDS